ncbi:ArsR family transcriptional regulator [Saprospiraceae bacterium]|nr:ArsR family transcriptional regulator [Saprospiraceae bacterium]
MLKFFLNSNNVSYLRGLEQEFGESTNSIRLELNRFEKSGLLTSFLRGNKKYFQANTQHPLFDDIHNIVKKHIGFDQIILNILDKLGDLQQVYVLGAFARGLDSSVIDLLLIGDINKSYFIQLLEKVESLIGRRIRYIIYKSEPEIDWGQYKEKPLLLWEQVVS